MHWGHCGSASGSGTGGRVEREGDCAHMRGRVTYVLDAYRLWKYERKGSARDGANKSALWSPLNRSGERVLGGKETHLEHIRSER